MLHNKYRPQTLDEILGNKATVESLNQVLARHRKDQPRAFLFTGPSGCGKTTLARILASEFKISEQDLIEVDSADFRGIDFIRDIRRRMHLNPREGNRRGWILDECHQLSKDAQSALLKALEEPPAHVIFFLATTEPEKLLPTLRNRCNIYSVTHLEEKAIYRLLKRVTKAEGKAIGKEIALKIVDSSNGSPRRALTLLDKLIDSPKETQMHLAESAERQEAEIIDLCRILFKGQDWAKIALLLTSLRRVAEAEDVRRAVLGYCSSILMKGKEHPQAYILLDAFREPFYNTGWPGLVLACYEALVSNRDE